MRTCIYADKSTFLTGMHAHSVQNWCFLAKYYEGAEITVGPELGALTLVSYLREKLQVLIMKFLLKRVGICVCFDFLKICWYLIKLQNFFANVCIFLLSMIFYVGG